ncbi:MAG: hypothetical protein KBT06_01880 [Prevotellaceae bacterium]|nr:hypothetical protein [Candidatus Colivivens equi]
MRIINKKPVKRCEKCNHLIPLHFDKCPYCEGTVLVKHGIPESNNTEIDDTEFHMPPLSKKAKKRILYAGIAVVAVGLVAIIISLISSLFVLNKTIFEPIDDEELQSLIDDDPGFAAKYQWIAVMRDNIVLEEEKALYEKVTYKELCDFIDVYTDTAKCNEIARKANEEFNEKYYNPIIPKLEAKIEEFTEYINTHDVENYLEIEVGKRYEYEHGRYYPGFYFTLSFPTEQILDCRVRYGMYNKKWGYLHYSARGEANLEELQEMCESARYRWTDISSFSPNIYDEWELDFEILSVTKANGEVISPEEARKVVTPVVLEYLEDPYEYTELLFIREQIDSNFPDRNDYIYKKLDEELDAINPICNKLVNRFNDTRCSLPCGWNQ